MNDSNEKDLTTIGQHCSFESCNRLDFLPVKCELCHLNYCKEHYSFSSHNCTKYQEKNEQNLTKISGNCRINFYNCTFEDCKQREMVEVICEFCTKRLCMKHRLQIDHTCSKLESNLTNLKPKSTKKEFNFELKQNVSEKNMPLAAKLNLMKLKQSAVGPPGLPEQSKFFCFVIQNSIESVKKPFFFSNKWPIGKCIEFLAEKLKIEKSKQNNMQIFLDSNHVPSSSTVEELQKNNIFPNHGLVLNLISN